MFKLFTRIIAAFALGLVISVWILQNTASVKKQVYTKIILALQKEWDAHIDVESFKINFFTCSIFFKQGKIFPANKKQYAWKFEDGLIHISPIQLLINKRIALDIAFNNVTACTNYHNKQADLIDHVYNMFKQRAGGMPIGAESITINNIDLATKLTEHLLVIHAPGTIAFSKQKHASGPVPQSWKGSIALTNASVTYDKKPILYHVNGACSLQKHRVSGNWFCNAKTTIKSTLLEPEKIYSCSGTWEPEQKKLSLVDPAGDLTITTSLQQYTHLIGKIPLTVLGNAIKSLGSDAMNTSKLPWSSQGSCQAQLTFDQNDATWGPRGTLIFSDLNIATLPLQHVAIKLAPTKPPLTASELDITQSPQAQLTGSLLWNWDAAAGSLTLTNTHPLALPQKNTAATEFSILPHDLNLSASFGKKTNVQGTYLCILTNQKTEKPYTYKGAFLFKNNVLGIKGKTSHGDYELNAALTPQPCLKNIYYTARGRTLIDMHTTAPYTLTGTMRWAFVRSFLDQSLQRLVFNDNCVLAATLHQQDLAHLSGSCKLAQGTFFIPDFHNLIQNVSLDWRADLTEKKLSIDNLTLTLSKGTITCPHATATWDQHYNLSMLHAPLSIHTMFINWKRDFYGLVYGNLLLNKLPESPAKLSGLLVLKKSLLKDTFFSQETTQSFYGPLGGKASSSPLPVGLSIRLLTEKPVTAKTPALNAAATLDLTINNIVGKDFYSSPYLTGAINLDNGHLKFFNNKLQIEQGRIQFVANHINDPLIDLIAKNRINKYLINLQVTGSLQKPTILLESTPELTEEQIVGLLLSGSENASLQADLPVMLLQNLDSFIFKNNKNSKHAGLFDKISKTFKYIQITPNLTDTADAGKLKGSISVNLNDQLRAQIQKNLDLQKDFSAHVEYMLSDDINLKVIKDQRGELGSEVEMRLKLG